jgi:hypothetical protein
MREAGEPSTGGWVVPAPPGIVLVAPPPVPRNAEGAQSERPRYKEGSKKRGQRHHKAGARKPRPDVNG